MSRGNRVRLLTLLPAGAELLEATLGVTPRSLSEGLRQRPHPLGSGVGNEQKSGHEKCTDQVDYRSQEIRHGRQEVSCVHEGIQT